MNCTALVRNLIDITVLIVDSLTGSNGMQLSYIDTAYSVFEDKFVEGNFGVIHIHIVRDHYVISIRQHPVER